MFLRIHHTTLYRYDRPVFLQPHTLRVTPRADSCRVLLRQDLQIAPSPSGISRSLESDGSFSHSVCFPGYKTEQFSVDVQLVLELNNTNPFDFIIFPYACRNLPMVYPEGLSAGLNAFQSLEMSDERVKDFADEIFKEAQGRSLDFLIVLSRVLKERFVNSYRKNGEPYPAVKTLNERMGSCRDLAVLFMTVAGSVGFACRFVSGYYFGGRPDPAYLHAWVEVYIPGGGWRGFDPTLGLACGCHHIALCATGFPSRSAYVEGSLIGQVRSQMDVQLKYIYQEELGLLRQAGLNDPPAPLKFQSQVQQ